MVVLSARLGMADPQLKATLLVSALVAVRHGPPRLYENHAEVFVSDYSYRSATMGSTLAARRAGT